MVAFAVQGDNTGNNWKHDPNYVEFLVVVNENIGASKKIV